MSYRHSLKALFIELLLKLVLTNNYNQLIRSLVNRINCYDLWNINTILTY